MASNSACTLAGAVDLVGQHQIGEDRSLVHAELGGARVVDLRAYQVGRQQVGRELDAGEMGVDGLSRGLDQQRLGQTRNAFQQHVAVGQQGDHHPLHQHLLADHHLVDLGQQVMQVGGLLPDAGIQLAHGGGLNAVA
ncbi:MAG: hypothetical protein R2844_10570 [Caldilineales bacterium]